MTKTVKKDKDGVDWVTSGYMYTKIVIAREEERRAIIEWIAEQMQLCDLQIYNEQDDRIKNMWYERKEHFNEVKKYIESKSPLSSNDSKKEVK